MPNQDSVIGQEDVVVKTPRKLRPYEKVNILNKAINVLDSGWTRGTEARDKSNYEVEPESKDAVRFCAIGAVYRATKCNRYRDEIINALEANLTGEQEFLADFNDDETRRKRDVVRLFRRTIKNIKNPVE